MSDPKKSTAAVEWVAEPKDRDDAETREVYAYAGLALYLAQCLEHEIVNSLVSAAHMRRLRTKWPATSSEIAEYRADIDHVWDEAFQQTLGKLVNSVSSSGIKIPESLDSDLRQSVRLRNRLVHRYFRERAETWFSSEERRSMAEELKAMGEQFVKTDRALHEITSQIWNALGITEDKVDLMVELTKAGASEEEIERAIG